MKARRIHACKLEDANDNMERMLPAAMQWTEGDGREALGVSFSDCSRAASARSSRSRAYEHHKTREDESEWR